MRHSSPGKPIGTCAIPTQSRHNLDAISTQSRGISRPSEARRGNQWQSAAIKQSAAIRGHRRQSEAIALWNGRVAPSASAIVFAACPECSASKLYAEWSDETT